MNEVFLPPLGVYLPFTPGNGVLRIAIIAVVLVVVLTIRVRMSRR